MSDKKPEAGWYVRQDHPHEIMDCIGNHVAVCYGKDGDEADARAGQIVTAVNERALVEDVTEAARKVCEFGAKQLHMKNLRRSILALQKHRATAESLKEMREKH